VVTSDDSLSAHWEHTLAVFKDRTEILTEWVG
jgi:methionine aminopeptidase